MSEWQPIETAPKDGRSVFIAGMQGQHWRMSTAFFWNVAEWKYADWVTDEPGFGDPFCWKPTHWMPLPEPPKGSQ